MFSFLKRTFSFPTRALSGSNSLRSPGVDDPSSSQLHLMVEALEPRVMLSGNVMAAFVGSNLFVTGDFDDNDISIEVVENDLVLVGNQNTTINGSNNSFVISEGSSRFDGNVRARLMGGDDRLVFLAGATIGGKIKVDSGAGHDDVGFSGSTAEQSVILFTERGDDEIALNDATIGGMLLVHTQAGDDVISLVDSEISMSFLVNSGSGDDDILLETTTVGDDVRVRMLSGEDDMVVRNATIGDDLHVVTGTGDDFFCIDPTVIEGTSIVRMRSGDDNVIYALANEFKGLSLVSGGSGADNFEVDPVNIFRAQQIGISNATDKVPTSVLNERLGDPANGVFALSDDAQAMLGSVPNNGGDLEDGDLNLTVNVSQNSIVQAGGRQVVETPEFVITGTATPGATVEVARDADGVFDDASTVVDSNGNYSLTVTLVNQGEAQGENDLVVRAKTNLQQQTEAIDAYYAVGSVVEMASSFGNIYIELFVDANESATTTSGNFLNYIRDTGQSSSRFTDSIIHRSVDFATPDLKVIQGGGFAMINDALESISEDPAIVNEFGASNVAGTIAMALTSVNNVTDIDSATSQWFINVADNSAALDSQKFAVFGRIIGNGLSVAESIHDLDTFDVSSFEGNGLTDVPLQNYTGIERTLTGTVSISDNSDLMIGTGTSFLSDLVNGQTIEVGSETFEVAQVDSDTQVTLTQNVTGAVVDQQVTVANPPQRENYVELTTVSEVSF